MKVLNPTIKILALCALSMPGCTSKNTNVQPLVQSSPPPANMNPSVPPRTSPDKLLIQGRIDCRTKEIFVEAGMLGENRFRHLKDVSSALEEKKYDGGIFNELEKIKVCELAGGDDFDIPTETHEQRLFDRVSRPTLLLEATLEKRSVPFFLREVTFEGYDSLISYLTDAKSEKGCKPISKNCMKCGKKIYCQGGKPFSRS